jgi:hypothetical protein
MIGENEVREVIARLCGFYPRSQPPANDEGILAAWVDHFSQFTLLSMSNVMAGIRAYTNDPSHEFFPAPAAISRAARDHWNDRYQRCQVDNGLVRELFAAGMDLELAQLTAAQEMRHMREIEQRDD